MSDHRYNLIVLAAIIFLLKGTSCRDHLYDGHIAGGRTIAECNNGGRSEMELNTSTPRFIANEGYPIEIHNVVTEDGYILTMHRIPGPPGATPVFIQHGQITSSFDWVILGRNRSLALLLADRGYDVWMGNNRGSTYSNCHQYYLPSDRAYWEFSWHEMGVYDLTAEFTYVTNITNQKLIYIGYSSGTTSFYALAADRPHVTKQVKVMFGLASIAYEYHFKSPVRLGRYFVPVLELYSKLFGLELKETILIRWLSEYFCYRAKVLGNLCAFGVDSLVGYDLEQLDWETIHRLIAHSTSGNKAATSIKCFIHYLQLANSNKFQHYDYGTEKNLKLYHTQEPPDYNISNIQLPVGIYYAENDYLVSPIDVKRFYRQLPNKMFLKKVKYEKFNHFDYLMAKDMPELLYNDLLCELERHR